MPPMSPAAAVCLGAKFSVEDGEESVSEASVLEAPVLEAPVPLAEPELEPVDVAVAEPEPLLDPVVAVAQMTSEGTLTPLALQSWSAAFTAAAWSFSSQAVVGRAGTCD